MSRAEPPPEDPYEISFAVGGPVYRLLHQLGLVEPPLRHMARRIAGLVLLLWLPLLILCLIDGTALPGSAGLPFLHDLSANVRFLLVAPLFVYAEGPVHERTRKVLRTFRERGLIAEETLERFRGSVGLVLRLRNSVVLELALLAGVFVLGQRLSLSAQAGDGTSWWQAADGELTRAGWWSIHVSLPLVRFLLLRWLYRLLLWSFLMWRISRLELALIPTHPDRAGGLGFLGEVTTAFSPLLLALSTLVAGIAGGRILVGHETLQSMQVEIGCFVALALALALGPLCFFAPRLAQAKREGKRAYGDLAARYTREFEAKWVHGTPPAGAALLGSADIQSLADLGGGHEAISGMRPVPFGLDVVLALAWPVVAPLLPLALTVLPLDELLKKVLGLLL